jgi:effector-binding domain-containing protein
MRILKYILLLVLLLLIGLTVFVSTQKADYNVTRSKVIKSPKATLYNYVNDYRNWETFDSKFLADKSLSFTYTEVTSGKGASFSWNGSFDGKMNTLFAKENDSIFINRYEDGEKSEVCFKFKDTIGGTKVTWKSKGKLDFKSKVLSFFNGGINSVVGNEYEKSLDNLNKTLNYELNTFSIKVNGIVNRAGTFYLKQTILSREKNVAKNIKILLPRMAKFVDKNKIATNGKPFILYTKYDRVNDLIGLSVCIPVRDSIFISAGSDMQSGQLPAYTALKTTLTGDYSHSQKVWKKGYEYLAKNKLERNTSLQIIEVYAKNSLDVKTPSEWITETYIPIFPKTVAPKPVYRKPNDSTAVKPVVPSESSSVEP